jgi:hypothetical protein
LLIPGITRFHFMNFARDLIRTEPFSVYRQSTSDTLF